MKVVLVFVSTLNGKITRSDDPEVRHWTSESDQEYYKRVWADSRLVVMGSRTFDLNKITASESRLIVVMTSRPADYGNREVRGQLEFTDKSPADLISFYKAAGYGLMTVVGGPSIAASFLKHSLVNELWLTLEPKLFGSGLDLIKDEHLEVSLKMIEHHKVNDTGTLITKYLVEY